MLIIITVIGLDHKRGVTQLGSVSALGAESRRFESCHPEFKSKSKDKKIMFVLEFENQSIVMSLITKGNSRFLQTNSKLNYTPKGIRIPVTSVKGKCPRPLDDGGLASNYILLNFFLFVNFSLNFCRDLIFSIDIGIYTYISKRYNNTKNLKCVLNFF